VAKIPQAARQEPTALGQSDDSSTSAALRSVLPTSRPIVAVVTVAWLAEALLVARGKPSLYEADWSTIRFGLLFLTWFWVTVGWLLQGTALTWRRSMDQSTGLRRCLLWLALAVPSAMALIAYIVSWGLFIRSGRLANLETGRLLLFNARQLGDYLVAAEPVQLMTGAAIVLLSLVVVPWFLSWSVSPQRLTRCPRPARALVGWTLLTLVTLTAWNHFPIEASVLRRSVRVHALSHGLNPTFSLYVSNLEANNVGRIRPDLDVSRLHPLRPATDTLDAGPPADVPAVRPSVIFVAVESLRHDAIHQRHQGKEILPNINQLAHGGLHLTRAYSQSTHSDYSDTCLVSSLYPLRSLRHHYYSPSDPWPKTLIYDLLKNYGYTTAIISSQNERWGRMADFLQTDGLDYFYHPETSRAATMVSSMDPGFSREVRLGGLVAGKFPDAHTTDQAIQWISERISAAQPYFLSINLQSSHFPYLMPDEVPRPFQPCELDPRISFVDYPIEQVTSVRNAYFNAIHECDRQIGRLVAALRDLGQLENTILVVTGENGEAFHECGCVTHARDPVEPAIHVACVIHAPQWLTPRVDDYPFEHVDLVPTVCGLLKLPAHPNWQGIDVLAADRTPAAERLTFCHVLSSLSYSDSVTLGGRWKLTLDRRSGSVTLYDVALDPGQRHDLAAERPELAQRLREALRRWRAQQLAYYHFPTYYLSYYPPAPPRWDEIATPQGAPPPAADASAARTVSDSTIKRQPG
jgi:arylsulfatase A-like enzyme